MYDYIIIDTPPVNVVSDAMVMSNSVSGILLVVKYGSTTFGDISESLKQVELANANLLGLVLNDVQSSNSVYYYKHKSGYYRYGSDYEYKSGESTESD